MTFEASLTTESSTEVGVPRTGVSRLVGFRLPVILAVLLVSVTRGEIVLLATGGSRVEPDDEGAVAMEVGPAGGVDVELAKAQNLSAETCIGIHSRQYWP